MLNLTANATTITSAQKRASSALSEIRAQRIRLAMADVDNARAALNKLLGVVDSDYAVRILAEVSELERAIVQELTLRSML